MSEGDDESFRRSARDSDTSIRVSAAGIYDWSSILRLRDQVWGSGAGGRLHWRRNGARRNGRSSLSLAIDLAVCPCDDHRKRSGISTPVDGSGTRTRYGHRRGHSELFRHATRAYRGQGCARSAAGGPSASLRTPSAAHWPGHVRYAHGFRSQAIRKTARLSQTSRAPRTPGTPRGRPVPTCEPRPIRRLCDLPRGRRSTP
jgi:hypothetical protein